MSYIKGITSEDIEKWIRREHIKAEIVKRGAQSFTCDLNLNWLPLDKIVETIDDLAATISEMRDKIRENIDRYEENLKDTLIREAEERKQEQEQEQEKEVRA